MDLLDIGHESTCEPVCIKEERLTAEGLSALDVRQLL